MEYQNKPGYLTVRDYEKIYGSKLYDMYIIEKGDFSKTFFPHITVGGRCGVSLAYDLGKLDHFIDYGVDIERLKK